MMERKLVPATTRTTAAAVEPSMPASVSRRSVISFITALLLLGALLLFSAATLPTMISPLAPFVFPASFISIASLLPSASLSPTVSLSPSTSPSLSASPSPSGLPSAAVRVLYAQRGATGNSMMPANLSVSARDAASGDVFSRHECVGEWNAMTRQGNRTCVFFNLYSDGAASEPWVRAVWDYVTVLPSAYAGEPAAYAVALAREFADVRLAASNREAAQWFITVLVYERLSVNPENGSATVFPQPATFGTTAPAPRSFLMQRAVPSNIGHSLWEEHVPFFSALGDAGFEGAQRDFSPLLLDPVAFPHQPLFFPASSFLYEAVVPRGKPRHMSEWAEAVGAQLVRFPVLAAGLMGRTAGGYPADYSTPGHELGLVWRFRKAYLRNLGLQADDNITRAARPLQGGEPFNVIIVQKLHKRAFRNPDEVRDAIARSYPAANVRVMSWETLGGGHVAEVRALLNASLVITMSGTGANTAFLLPRGAVLINTGALSPLGRTGHVGDCFLHAIEHVRLLHYTGHAAEDASGSGQDAALTLPLPKIMPLVDSAVAWLKSGAGIAPVRWPDNHSPQGKFTACLLHRYPLAQWWASYFQGIHGDASTHINADPREWYKRAASNTRAATRTVLMAPLSELPVAPDAALPPDFDEVLVACASWSGADVRERIGGAALNGTGAPPPWVSARIAAHAALRTARPDLCRPGVTWCGE